MQETEKHKIQQAADFIRKSKNAVAFTGAGISTPSGIPDFRSPGGLWSRFDPVQVASAQALDVNPERVWEFLLETTTLLDSSEPNPAHLALAELEKQQHLLGVITQNIDNLHQRAGSECVVEYHGNFQRFYCRECHAPIPVDQVRRLTVDTIPLLCPGCRGLVRPDVVFFGECIPPAAQIHSDRLLAKADLMIIAGTSGEVSPANSLPNRVKMNTGTIIEINLGPTAYGSITDIRFDAPVESILPALARAVLA